MRAKLALAGLGIGIAAALLPVAPASASCVYISEDLPCYNPCMTAAAYYNKVAAKLGQDPANCPT